MKPIKYDTPLVKQKPLETEQSIRLKNIVLDEIKAKADKDGIDLTDMFQIWRVGFNRGWHEAVATLRLHGYLAENKE